MTESTIQPSTPEQPSAAEAAQGAAHDGVGSEAKKDRDKRHAANPSGFNRDNWPWP